MNTRSAGMEYPSGLPWTLTWQGQEVAWYAAPLAQAARRFREMAYVVRHPQSQHVGVAFGGAVASGEGYDLLGILPPLYPEWLGDRSFCASHGVRFPYVVGEMARGIATARMVVEAGRAGLLGFFGAAGLPPEEVQAAVKHIAAQLGKRGWGVNLIHSPGFAMLEEAVVDVLLHHDVTLVCASAFLGLTPAVVRYACKGLAVGPDGTITRHNHLVAKISRPEVARHFMAPPPQNILRDLVSRGQLTEQEAQLAAHVPLAGDVTIEGDSGGHTDNQVLGAVFPIIAALRDRLVAQHGHPIRLGAGGGLGTPQAVASAFALGAAYVVTGSVNQSAVESGVSPIARAMLAKADVGDVAMSPSADMFEMGVKVQVLKKGTMFASRAGQLYDLYVRYPSIEAIPQDIRQRLEAQVFRKSLDEVWDETRAFFEARAPREAERAQKDPKHKMALTFRWYLGQSSRWPMIGDESRTLDYQLWCGPAMAAFNEWVAGSFLEPAESRTVAQIGYNLMEGAAQVTRAHQLRSYGVPMPQAAFAFAPRPLR